MLRSNRAWLGASMKSSDHIPLWAVAMLAALIPFITIHVTFLVSVYEGYVPLCNPYIDSCTSISRTGRHGTAYFIFKGAMLPAALLGWWFWWLNRRWLHQLGASPNKLVWLPWLGLAAALALGAYTLTLGHHGDGFRLIRRTGVVLYFSLTFIAQLILSAALVTTAGWTAEGRRLLRLCQLVLGIGILSVLLTAFAYGLYSQIDDAFEWVLALLINTHALWVAILWRRSGFHAKLWASR